MPFDADTINEHLETLRNLRGRLKSNDLFHHDLVDTALNKLWSDLLPDIAMQVSTEIYRNDRAQIVQEHLDQNLNLYPKNVQDIIRALIRFEISEDPILISAQLMTPLLQQLPDAQHPIPAAVAPRGELNEPGADIRYGGQQDEEEEGEEETIYYGSEARDARQIQGAQTITGTHTIPIIYLATIVKDMLDLKEAYERRANNHDADQSRNNEYIGSMANRIWWHIFSDVLREQPEASHPALIAEQIELARGNRSQYSGHDLQLIQNLNWLLTVPDEAFTGPLYSSRADYIERSILPFLRDSEPRLQAQQRQQPAAGSQHERLDEVAPALLQMIPLLDKAASAYNIWVGMPNSQAQQIINITNEIKRAITSVHPVDQNLNKLLNDLIKNNNDLISRPTRYKIDDSKQIITQIFGALAKYDIELPPGALTAQQIDDGILQSADQHCAALVEMFGTSNPIPSFINNGQIDITAFKEFISSTDNPNIRDYEKMLGYLDSVNHYVGIPDSNQGRNPSFYNLYIRPTGLFIVATIVGAISFGQINIASLRRSSSTDRNRAIVGGAVGATGVLAIIAAPVGGVVAATLASIGLSLTGVGALVLGVGAALGIRNSSGSIMDDVYRARRGDKALALIQVDRRANALPTRLKAHYKSNVRALAAAQGIDAKVVRDAMKSRFTMLQKSGLRMGGNFRAKREERMRAIAALPHNEQANDQAIRLNPIHPESGYASPQLQQRSFSDPAIAQSHSSMSSSPPSHIRQASQHHQSQRSLHDLATTATQIVASPGPNQAPPPQSPQQPRQQQAATIDLIAVATNLNQLLTNHPDNDVNSFRAHGDANKIEIKNIVSSDVGATITKDARENLTMTFNDHKLEAPVLASLPPSYNTFTVTCDNLAEAQQIRDQLMQKFAANPTDLKITFISPTNNQDITDLKYPPDPTDTVSTYLGVEV